MFKRIIGIAVLLAVMHALPAAAAQNACDKAKPTGAPVPRQEVAEGNNSLYPSPSWQGATSGTVTNGQRFTVERECGLMLQIRTDNGAEGWVPLAISAHERDLYRESFQASRKPPTPPKKIATAEECRRQIQDPVISGLCRERIAKGRTWP